MTGPGVPAGPERLQGRVGVVTGAGRGIGREVSRALAAEGMALLLLSRTDSELRSLAAELDQAYGVPVLPAVVDVTDAAALDRVVAHAEQQLGPVDLLVNNAARIETTERPFWEADPAEVWGVVETNLRGPMLLCRALLPAMVQRGHGHVVNLTSRARGATHTGTYTGYAVSKRALSVLTETLALSLRGTGVVVVDVLPGLVRTPMTDAMPVWQDVPDDGWSPASATSQVVVDVALGVHDERSGDLLEAPELAGD
ncbi:MAG: SDR family NAD(P)-dependent oxidoreductase [Mycobacteriales bacterium]